MALLAVLHGWWGLWALAAPRHFFDTFPGAGRRWTAAYPPFNEHLVIDLGATFVTLAFLLGAGAASRSRSARTVALLTVTLFGALHLAFHAADHGLLATTDLVASLIALALGFLIPVALLVLDRWAPPERASGARGDADTRRDAAE
jgi:hypothetical protein